MATPDSGSTTDAFAEAARDGAEHLRASRHDVLASYLDQAAGQLDRFARRVRQAEFQELIDDAQRLVQRQPAMVIGSAFVLGLCGARFVKSAPGRRDHERYRASEVPESGLAGGA